jgi:sortase A
VIVPLSVGAVGVGLAIAGYIGWFLVGSSIRGSALERQASATVDAVGGCRSLPGVAGDGGLAGTGPGGEAGGNSAVRGLLEAPALGLAAPVLQGTSDAVLGEAVGHVTGSAWPGSPGTSVLSAHDVTWFSSIGKLKPGDVVRYVTPCRTYVYQVTAHHIVPAGSPVYTTAAERLVLDTCYPFSALYITSIRYLVYADLTSAGPTHPLSAPPPGGPAPRVPAPAKLAAQGLGLGTNDAPLGDLTLTGSPSVAWRQSSAPLNTEAAALAAYFGILRSAEQGRQSWWAALAPSVPVSAAAPIWRGGISGYVTAVDITLDVHGAKPDSAGITAIASTGTGTYRVTAGEAVRDGQLLVTGFSMRPAW